jgi:hypothetical protein
MAGQYRDIAIELQTESLLAGPLTRQITFDIDGRPSSHSIKLRGSYKQKVWKREKAM